PKFNRASLQADATALFSANEKFPRDNLLYRGVPRGKLTLAMAISTDKLPTTLSNDEVLRYSRHLLLPEVGMEGQLKLKQARVLCVGAGGLGSPVAMYLAAAGLGTLGIVDFDIVDFTNLQRQIIHSTDDVGRKKLD